MENNWNLTKLKEHVVHQKGHAFKSSDFRPNGTPIVRVSNFTTSSIDVNSCICISSTKFSQFKTYALKKDDVVIATVGSWASNPSSIVGKVIQVPLNASGTLLNQNAVILRTNSTMDQNYLYYLLKTSKFKNYIVGTAQGGVFSLCLGCDKFIPALRAVFPF